MLYYNANCTYIICVHNGLMGLTWVSVCLSANCGKVLMCLRGKEPHSTMPMNESHTNNKQIFASAFNIKSSMRRNKREYGIAEHAIYSVNGQKRPFADTANRSAWKLFFCWKELYVVGKKRGLLSTFHCHSHSHVFFRSEALNKR